MRAHVKLIRRWEFQWSLEEAFQDGFCVFSHVKLSNGQIAILLTAPSVGRHTYSEELLGKIHLCWSLLKTAHLISLPQQWQLIAVNGTFHHMNVIVFNTEI